MTTRMTAMLTRKTIEKLWDEAEDLLPNNHQMRYRDDERSVKFARLIEARVLENARKQLYPEIPEAESADLVDFTLKAAARKAAKAAL